MSIPISFCRKIENGFAHLADDEAHHLISVLRKKVGDALIIVDGAGRFFTAELAELHKKTALARLLSEKTEVGKRPFRLHMAVAPTKNLDRFEWFLEKATEIGIEEITPIRCRRSEREVVRLDRLEKVIVAAMKQSQRAYLPKLNELVDFQAFMKKMEAEKTAQKFIAYCNDDALPLLKTQIEPRSDLLIFIGPEGDFSDDEIKLAKQNGFAGVSLGAARLRTETAAVAACLTASLMNES